MKHSTIPRKALPPNKLCPMKELGLQHDKLIEYTHDKREMYAKNGSLDVLPFLTIERPES